MRDARVGPTRMHIVSERGHRIIDRRGVPLLKSLEQRRDVAVDVAAALAVATTLAIGTTLRLIVAAACAA